MQYMLLFTEPASEIAKRNDPQHSEAYWGAWSAYVGAIAAPAFVSGNGLQPPFTATTVRVRDGKRLVQDGPFADSKEQLGGYFIIDVPISTPRWIGPPERPRPPPRQWRVRPVLPPMAPPAA